MVTGYIGVVTDWDHCSELLTPIKLKLLSIAQDIVSVSRRGAQVTPQSLVLDFTLRHMTGSKDLNQLITKLGDVSCLVFAAHALKQAVYHV